MPEKLLYACTFLLFFGKLSATEESQRQFRIGVVLVQFGFKLICGHC